MLRNSDDESDATASNSVPPKPRATRHRRLERVLAKEKRSSLAVKLFEAGAVKGPAEARYIQKVTRRARPVVPTKQQHGRHLVGDGNLPYVAALVACGALNVSVVGSQTCVG